MQLPPSSPALTDPNRLAVLRDAMLEDPPDQTLDPLTWLAAKALHVPASLITFVDAERELVQSSAGLPESWGTRRVFPLDQSLCQYLVATGESLLIENSGEHEWAADKPLVRELGVVAYAGIPLRTREGHVLGGLCVIDHRPHAWAAEEVEILTQLARVVEVEIGQRLALRGEQRQRKDAARSFEAEISAAAQFRLLVEKSLVGIYLLQGDRMLYANPRMHEIFGYPAGTPLSELGVSDLVAPEDLPRVREYIRQRMEGERESLHYTSRGVRKDGTIIDVEVLGSRTVLDDGQPAVIGSLLDVTERTRAEEELRKSAERLRLVERATEDLVWEWNVRTGEILWSELGSRLFRYRPEEVGRTVEWHHARIHPDDRERVTRGLEEVLGKVAEFWADEYRLLRGDGLYVTVLDRGYVVRNGRGEPVRMIGTMMDVTERRREEEAQRFLSQASELLDSSLETEAVLGSLARLSVPILGDCCLIDLPGENGEMRRVGVAHADPATEALLIREGALAEEEGDSSALAALMNQGESVFLPECSGDDLDVLGRRAEEREALRGLGFHSLIIVPLMVGERKLGTIALGASGSRRRLGPADLLLAQDLAHRTARAIDRAQLYLRAMEATRAREEVLGVVTHDLRSPLHTIQMSADMLRDVGRERRAENQKWLDVICRTVEQMSKLIDDLLAVSSIEAGRFSIQLTDRSVSAVVHEACELLEPLVVERGLRFESEVAEDLSTIPIDSDQIMRVISNLVGNAVKFTPAGGTVTLRVETQEENILFSVSDTGPGIAAEQLPQVFDRFWQARPGDRRGVGLGLTIAKGIVEAHGGRIWVQSMEGRGTTFFFTLPATNGSPRPDPGQVPQA